MVRITKNTHIILIGYLLLISLLTPAFVFAADSYGLDTAAKEAGFTKMEIYVKHKTAMDIAADAVGIGLSFVGIIFFLLMLYAGFQWMMAMGNSEKAEKSKDMIEAAVIGLIIVLAAYAIATFVFKGLGISGTTNSSGGGDDSKCTATSGKCIDLSKYICIAGATQGLCSGSSERQCCVGAITKITE